MIRPFRIAIHCASLDHLTLVNGQYRYVVDLVRGLSRLPVEAEFILIGSRPEPPPELAELFAGHEETWAYRQLANRQGRGGFFLDQLPYRRLLRREQVDLVHALDIFLPVLAGTPVVVTQHDLMFELFPDYAGACRTSYWRFYRLAVRRLVRRVICISETTAQDLQRCWHVSPAKIDVVYHGSDFLRRSGGDGTAPALPLRLSGLADLPLVVSPYNLEPRKNLTTLLGAFARLRPEFPQARLVLFGRAAVSGEREVRFEAELARLGLGEAVVRTGFLGDGELASLYRHATVFAFPSLYEGFGLPVLEAMVCGACVVARNASAMAEVAGDACMLVETSDPEAVADALARLLRDPARREALGRAAAQRAGAFTIERMARQTYASYMSSVVPGASRDRAVSELIDDQALHI